MRRAEPTQGTSLTAKVEQLTPTVPVCGGTVPFRWIRQRSRDLSGAGALRDWNSWNNPNTSIRPSGSWFQVDARAQALAPMLLQLLVWRPRKQLDHMEARGCPTSQRTVSEGLI